MTGAMVRNRALLIVFFWGLLTAAAAQGLAVNGIAVQRTLGSDIFLAGLLLEYPSDSPQQILNLSQPVAMEIKVLSPISRRSWSSLWTQGVAINSAAEFFSQNAGIFASVLSAFREGLEPGDVVRFVYSPDAGMTLTVNDVRLLEKASAEVFTLLLRSWLGPVPPSTAFRQNLLGKGVSSEIRSHYQSLGPRDERRSAVRRWLEADTAPNSGVDTVASGDDAAAGEGDNGEDRIGVEENLPITELATPPAPESEPVPEAVAPAPATDDTGINREVPVADMPPSRPASVIGSAGPTENPESPALEGAAMENDAADTVNLPSRTQTVPPVLAATEAPADSADQSMDFSAEALIAQQGYIAVVRNAVYRQIRYPLSAMRRGLEGQLRVALELSRQGETVSVEILEPADYDGFNRELLRAIEAAAPFAALPPEIAGETFVIDTPFAFKIAR